MPTSATGYIYAGYVTWDHGAFGMATRRGTPWMPPMSKGGSRHARILDARIEDVIPRMLTAGYPSCIEGTSDAHPYRHAVR